MFFGISLYGETDESIEVFNLNTWQDNISFYLYDLENVKIAFFADDRRSEVNILLCDSSEYQQLKKIAFECKSLVKSVNTRSMYESKKIYDEIIKKFQTFAPITKEDYENLEDYGFVKMNFFITSVQYNKNDMALEKLSSLDIIQSSILGYKKAEVGISLPTKVLQRWNQDGANMKAQLEKAGYAVDLQYAANDIPTQISQIENMVTGGCKVLVIAAIDGSALSNVLDSAKKKGIQVIAYDRLIMNSDAVSYYATFDNYKVGTMQGDYLVDALKLKRLPDNPVYMEFFTGDPGDNNINFFFGGAMDVLTPYLNFGVIKCLSGQTEKAQAATLNWSTEEARKRMENLIIAHGYSPNGTRLDAVYCSNDSIANGVTIALREAGYTAENFPIITGQDCDKVSVKNIIAGTQAMSVFKDTRTLTSKVVEMVDAIMKGTNPPINDTRTYFNGTGIIPSYLCEPVYVTKNNYRELLINSGYYTEYEIKR